MYMNYCHHQHVSILVKTPHSVHIQFPTAASMSDLFFLFTIIKQEADPFFVQFLTVTFT